MTATKNLGMDLGTQGGAWLFRQGDLVLGPVSAAEIVERLYAGEIDGRTLVSDRGPGAFQRISEIEFFKVHVAKAEAKHRVDQVAKSYQQKSVSRRNRRIAIV